MVEDHPEYDEYRVIDPGVSEEELEDELEDAAEDAQSS